ncbi:HGGxSTG domain-containing protein [Aestuariicoccus sp. MJ-SS9]|uniref:HGGxSTG domain-containing protein n=1 Tax=Aestuariicoccus sp. MJ-SS9 TaxID=3079855 RepID=UPI00290C0F64|nr:HGGxSTG domain-containing protein [Aestuariicoccus sp. MJ-SS9]MDU8911784.1 HGGxSTG domain-containing protein [Aestuariicoccus sp. MJ-SS9]
MNHALPLKSIGPEPKASTYRQECGAKTRNGNPCRLLPEPGKQRCKFHGGKSTGPTTEEGKARIAEAQRKRWARARAAKANAVRLT